MRISFHTLHYSPLSGSGSSLSLQLFVQALAKRGHTLSITTLLSDGNRFDTPPCEIREKQFSGDFRSLQRYVAQLMHADTADVFIIFGPSLLWAGGFYKKMGGQRPVAAYINNYTAGMMLHRAPSGRSSAIRHFVHAVKWRFWEKTLGRRLVSHIDHLYFDSPVVKRIYDGYGIRGKQSIVVPDPIEIERAASGAPFSKLPGIFHVLYTGRVMADKGPDILLKAAVKLPYIHVHIVGSGDMDEKLRSEIQTQGLSERVFLHGQKTPQELSAFYQNADVFAYPCRWPEPFGRVIVEALSAGLPVIATENTGPAWIAGDAGISIPRGNAAALTNAIAQIYTDTGLRERLAANAPKRAALFDAKIVGKQFAKEIESLA